jgi:uncharacterized protein YyaL (SSP411 family)
LDGYLDDYAYTIEAMIALFEATAQARWIRRAGELADQMVDLFEDHQRGGFFYTSADAQSLITRNKDWHDGSLVSGNASAVMGLLRLSRLVNNDGYRQTAERTFRAAGEVLEKQSAACGALLSALDRYRHDHEQIVLAVPDMETMTALRPQLLKTFRPHSTLSWVVGTPPESGPLAELNQHRPAVGGEPTLYHCRDYACSQPIVGPQAVQRWLA